MNAAISVLYMIEGCIFMAVAILYFMAVAYILLYRHSPYPDFKTGYHVSSAMESKDAWEYANKKAGHVCALCGVVLCALAAAQCLLRPGKVISLVLFFGVSMSVISILCAVFLPAYLLKRRFR